MKKGRGKGRMPAIGVTAGDPCGIGPEVIRAAMKGFARRHPGVSVRLIGEFSGHRPGRPTRASARAALAALEESVELLKRGEIQAVVNGPVCKESLQREGFDFPGQTEFYAARAGLAEDGVTMMMSSPGFQVALATTHCSLKEAVARLSPDLLVARAVQALGMLKALGLKKPRLAVAGLNPHAGEGGAFGDEEETIIRPAVARLRRKYGTCVDGPHVPDVVFRRMAVGDCDAVLALYHDQGLIPFKLLAFERGVNVTCGLPFWRMSPDHGTAFDIAGRGKADARSMRQALEMAVCLSRKRPEARWAR
jgi:4-hydroxythreonine-4-phosphate dehydrogenase